MIIHGKEKGKQEEDLEFYDKIKYTYEKMDYFEVALINPDDYMSQNNIKDILNEENVFKLLKHNVNSIKNNIKSYQAWYQRRFILNKFLYVENEYFLITECIKKDTRNFHCWNYTRWLINRIKQKIVTDQTKKIESQNEESKKHYIFDSSLDDIHNSENANKEKHYKILLKKLQNIPLKFYNLDFSNFSAIHNLTINDYVDQIYTDPYDEGLWVLHRKMKERELFIAKPFHIKVYDKHIEIILDNFTNEMVLQVNDKLYNLKSKYRINRFNIACQISKHDKIKVVVHSNEYNIIFEEKIEKPDDFVTEILEIDENCFFAWFELLTYTKNKEARKKIIDKLTRIDEKRKSYYQDLVFYYTI